jgi:glycosyltransferase involved in cell wall biosynthesis
MRIGVDIRSLRSESGRGVSHYTAAILSELIKRHPRDEWALLQTGRRPYRLPPELKGPAVSLRHRQQPNKLLNLALASGARKVESATGPLDVFFAPNFGFISLDSRTPLVVTVHDLSFARWPRLFSRRERAWHRMVRPRRLLRRADRVIAISEQTKRELQSLYDVPPEKITVIHSGIDDAYRRPIARAARKRVRRKYRLPDRYVLYLGAVEPRKNLPVLIEAHRRARGAGLESRLVIAGTGPQWRDSEDVHWLGYVDEADKPALYAEATGLALLSKHEGFGFPPLEALAARTPSLVSDLPVFRETIGEAALRTPIEPTTAAEKLVHLERDRATRQRLLGRRAEVLKRFTWAEAARRTYDVLAEVADAR